jgi:hypothetical protein
MTEKETKPVSPDSEAGPPRPTPVSNRSLDGLIEAGAPWWRRYSPHGEFPWSATGSLALHLLVVVAVIILAIIFVRPMLPERTKIRLGTAVFDEKGEEGIGKNEDDGPAGDERKQLQTS